MFRALIAAFALVCMAGVARADDTPKYAPAPDWVDTASVPEDAATASSPYVILDQQQRIDGDRLWSYADTALRITSTQMATEFGTINLTWQPEKGDIIIHRVAILRDGETIDVLAGEAEFSVLQREQQLEQAFITGTLTATLAVEGLRVGDILRFTYSVTQADDALGGNVQSLAPVMRSPMKVGFGRIRLLWPTGQDVHWKSHVEGLDVTESDSGGYHEVHIALPAPEEPDLPGDAPARYRELPLVEISSFDGWRDVSAAMTPLYRTEGLIAPGSPLAQEVAKIASATSDPRERAARALMLVQSEIRYLFQGMNGGNYVPQTPAETWERRYGDCKAKTLLLLAILHELGIEADPAMMSLTADAFVPQRLPMAGAFDHVLVRADIDGETYWLDGTRSGATLADIGNRPQSRHALPMVEAGASLEEIARRPHAQPDTVTQLEIDSRAGIRLPSLYSISTEIRGDLVDMLRTASATASPEQIEGFIKSIFSDLLGQNYYYLDGEISISEETGTATVQSRGIYWANWDEENGRHKLAIDPTLPDLTFTPNRARREWRDIPVMAGEYSDERVVTRYRLPEGDFTIEGARELPATLAGRAFTRSVTQTGAVVTVDDREVTGLGEVAAADIPATRRDVARIKAQALRLIAPADLPAYADEVIAAREAGLLDPLEEAFFELSNKPDDGNASGYLASAYYHRSTFNFDAALQDYTAALDVVPSAATYLLRSSVYQLTGDYDSALEDAREAMLLDPSMLPAVQSVIRLLSRTGNSEEALALAEEQIALGDSNRGMFVEAKADVLADAGRVDEAIALMDAEVAERPNDAQLLNARCWLKGTRDAQLESALADCQRAIELAESPWAIIDSRAMVYFRMGELEKALADFDAALEMAPGLPNSLFMRGIIRKRLGDSEGSRSDLERARFLAPGIEADYARYGIAP
ncbi:DUF3857 domain-containing protein [Stakelama tenebrarum]|uniref:DUF3857 domain-containing protein n=1 Tax=Stakelama tenebrarum TaxID=2711215 RepID=A0A6G6Y3Q4_9SPHN|nr:DUF3857 domain-containing protein [Sphingosinithalassobacter tenebrarum]QIG79243.1 DUF3857 domain-containing protein [Sphingosinithalassobacter tenebrarum]